MKEADENLALIAFTSLAPISVGGFVGVMVVDLADPSRASAGPAAVMLGVGTVALAASSLHLGRPFRAPRALWHWSSSWLSREVILFGLYLAVLAAYVFVAASSLWTQSLWVFGVVSAILGLSGVCATGMVYHLRARPAWNQWMATMTFPLGATSGGLLFGVAVEQSLSSSPPSGATIAVLLAISALSLLLALAFFWFRLNHLRRGAAETRESLRLALGSYRWTVALRIAAAVFALALIAFGGVAATFAWIPAVLGEIADRALFFSTVVPVSLSARSGARRVARVVGARYPGGNTLAERER